MFDILPDEQIVNLNSYPSDVDAMTLSIVSIAVDGAIEAQKNLTLKQVIEWGNGSCPHRGLTVKFKWECIECRIKLQKEVDGG